MLLGKKKMLAVFLEKDNLKLLSYVVGGKAVKRDFAGQITFSADVLREAFIADPAKFAGQIKMAFSQKPALAEVPLVVLFLPADKTFTKTMSASDSIDGFVQSLPYFAEELVINSQEIGEKVTHVAFEKKLAEDLQRPFLEIGKKVVAIVSSLNVLAPAHKKEGKYLLLAPFDKEISVAVCQDGGVIETATFPKDVFVGRLAEFMANHNLSEVRQVYTVGVFDADLAAKLRSERNLEVQALETGDVYDSVVAAYTRGQSGFKFDLSGFKEKLPEQKYLFLVAAVMVGFVLVIALVKGASKISLPGKTKTVSRVTAPVAAPQPAPKPADYPIRVLNGTLVTGEAGRLGDTLKTAGYPVLETKNATSGGFVNTRLRVVSDVPEKIVENLQTILTATYSGVSVEPLASDSARIEIIIGTKK